MVYWGWGVHHEIYAGAVLWESYDITNIFYTVVGSGIHFQNAPMAQAKLVRVTRGAVLDVAVDLRKGSPTYKQWISVELSGENKRMLFIPRGFGHGFVTLTDDVEFCYKVDNLYSKECDRGIRFDDSEIGVDWGLEEGIEPILSDKDKNAPLLKDSRADF